VQSDPSVEAKFPDSMCSTRSARCQGNLAVSECANEFEAALHTHLNPAQIELAFGNCSKLYGILGGNIQLAQMSELMCDVCRSNCKAAMIGNLRADSNPLVNFSALLTLSAVSILVYNYAYLIHQQWGSRTFVESL
jgi:hypothetical protein